jgi:3-deoxy-7-phosphoheptulonate synthase / chorismate mutase
MPRKTEIQRLRARIDTLSFKIFDLLSERARVANQIAEIKARSGIRFHDPQRESELLLALQKANKGPFSNDTVAALLREIMRASLELQEDRARQRLLVSRQPGQTNSVVKLAPGVRVGDGSFTVIAGPCAIESLEQMEQTAAALGRRGVKVLRGMAFKPRSSPYDFQGLGEAGLKIARKVANRHRMCLASEVLDASDVAMMSDYVDVFWVGARNMHNSVLLRALGKQAQPVVLKRSAAATVQELLYAAEYIAAAGNANIMLVERGIRTFNQFTRSTLDIGAVVLLKKETHLPVLVDISHSAGRRDFAVSFGRVAKAAGADGLIVEVHPNPQAALSDAAQQLTIPEFDELMDAIDAMRIGGRARSASRSRPR